MTFVTYFSFEEKIHFEQDKSHVFLKLTHTHKKCFVKCSSSERELITDLFLANGVYPQAQHSRAPPPPSQASGGKETENKTGFGRERNVRAARGVSLDLLSSGARVARPCSCSYVNSLCLLFSCGKCSCFNFFVVACVYLTAGNYSSLNIC